MDLQVLRFDSAMNRSDDSIVPGKVKTRFGNLAEPGLRHHNYFGWMEELMSKYNCIDAQ